jgi:hypothetical protein
MRDGGSMELVERMEEMIDGYAPDILLPEQFNELRRRRHELTGELRLMFAVLEDAIHCYLHHMNAKSRQRRILFYEVRDWMNSKHSKGIFAYGTLCDALGIDPDRLHKVLQQRQHELRNGATRTPEMRNWFAQRRMRLRRSGT